MKLYAELPGYKSRQIVADGFVVLWVASWVWIGRFIYSLVEKLAAPGRLIEGAGSDLAGSAAGVDARVAEVPVIGRLLEVPFESLERVGRTLQDAGQDQQTVVHTFAVWLGIILAVVPILFALYVWSTRRWRWVREASAADKMRFEAGGEHLLALRAIATRSLAELSATTNPAEAFASRDFTRLASLELNEMGLRHPPLRRGRRRRR